MRVKWLPLIANSFAVSGIVIAEPGVGATTRSAAHIDNSRVLRWIVSLIVWNSSVLSTKSLIQSAFSNGKGKGKGKDKPVYIHKPKSLIPSVKEHPSKDDACHHWKEVGHCKRNCFAYLAELIKKKQVGTASSSVSKNDVLYLNAIPRDGIYEIDMLNLDYALASATRILNMVLTKKVDKTPYELWYEKVPNLSYLKVWRCEALVKRDTPDKLQQRSVKCVFIGYPKKTIGY
ncbi:hypothetical protein Tco_0871162 [Tanacetum coccineum]